MLERTSVARRIAFSATRRITVLAAPAGFGKSVAIDAFVRNAIGSVLRFNVRRSDTSLARFSRSLAAAFEYALPRIGQSLAIAHERATQSAKPAEVLATWLAEHLDDLPRTIVIDDLHHCDGDRGIVALIANAIERTGPHVRWILAVRTSDALPLARWLAREDATLPIDENVLRLTEEEALALGARLAPMISPATVLRLRDRTNGAAAVFAFALRTLALDARDTEGLIAAGGDAFDRFADHVFARFTPIERTRLMEAVAFPELDAALLSRPGDLAWIESVESTAPHIFRTSDGRKQFAGLFFAYLRERLEERGRDAVRAATIRAANVLERAGRIDETLALYIRERHDAGLVRLVEEHGFAFLEAGYGDSIHEAIAALDPGVAMSSPTIIAIKAVWESTSGRFDTAESWFALALDRAGATLRPQIAYQYGTHLLRFFRPEAVEVFEQLAGAPKISDKLRAYALAALGPAYVFERRLEDAHRVVQEALILATAVGDAHTIAKAHFQASYVALYAGDAERAKRLATVAIAVANEHGYFDIASGSLSITYNVACDIEDDPVESLRLLEAVGECAAKSGSLTNQLITLVASLEIEIERNNETAAVLIDEKLQALDVSLAGRATYEALLPTQAMRATWNGDFAGAYRLLENTAGKHWSEDRTALRLAEIAAYAAAAGFEREASDAIDAACDVLAAIAKTDLRVQRARLMLALACVVLGRSEMAAGLLAKVDSGDRPLSRRLAALRDVIDTLLARYRGSRNHDRLLARLLELDRCGFAGMARTISMLPLGNNASQRAPQLSPMERTVVLRWADGKAAANDARLALIAEKLDCPERDTVLRAVTWHREAFERERAI